MLACQNERGNYLAFRSRSFSAVRSRHRPNFLCILLRVKLQLSANSKEYRLQCFSGPALGSNRVSLAAGPSPPKPGGFIVLFLVTTSPAHGLVVSLAGPSHKPQHAWWGSNVRTGLGPRNRNPRRIARFPLRFYPQTSRIVLPPRLLQSRYRNRLEMSIDRCPLELPE